MRRPRPSRGARRDNHGAFRALRDGRGAPSLHVHADAAAALDVVSALSRKAVEWRRADAAGARAFGAGLRRDRALGRAAAPSPRTVLAIVTTPHHAWQSPLAAARPAVVVGPRAVARSGSPRKHSFGGGSAEVDPVAKAAADQLKKLVAPAVGAARRLSPRAPAVSRE